MADIKVIAEIASAHGGDKASLINLLEKADQTGADFVKIQVFNFTELVHLTEGETSDLEQIELSINDWLDILSFAESNNINLLAEVYDLPSLQILKNKPSIAGFKIPTADINNSELIKEVAKEAKPVFIGIGGAKIYEIEESIKELSLNGATKIILLHGIQSFPTKLEDSFLSKVPLLKEKFNLEIGYADHIDAEDKHLAILVPSIAVAMGAKYIEKHITLDRSKKGFDYYSSLNPDEFTNFIKLIKSTSLAISDVSDLELEAAEISYRNKMKKFGILNADVSKGQLLSESDIVFKRLAETGLTRVDLNQMLDHRFKDNYQKNMPIQKEHLFIDE